MSTRELSVNRPVKVNRIWLAGIAAVVASVLANLVARALVLAALPLPEGFAPLQAPAIITFTVLGVVAATIVYAIVARVSKNPVRTYIIVAAVALIVSILPNFNLMGNPSAFPMPGGTPEVFGALIVFHVVAAVVSVAVLIGMTRKA